MAKKAKYEIIELELPPDVLQMVRRAAMMCDMEVETFVTCAVTARAFDFIMERALND